MKELEQASHIIAEQLTQLTSRSDELNKRIKFLDQQIELLTPQIAELAEKIYKTPQLLEVPKIQSLQAIAKTQKVTIVEYSIISDNDFGQIQSLRNISTGNIRLEEPQKKQKSLFIWVIKPTGEISFRQVDLKLFNASSMRSIDTQNNSKQSELTQLVDSTRRSFGVAPADLQKTGTLAFQANPDEMSRQLKQLHELLIDPIADLLPSDPNQPIIFIPQDALFLVPFPALRDANGQYLIEKHTILTAPSIQVLDLTRQQKQQIPSNGNALIVGNPIMPKQLAPLPSAEVEAKTIAPLFNTQPLIGAQATKAAVIAKMPQARLIHLATHGILDDSRGLGSALALTPFGKDDGFLTAEEILDMKLTADLVVLSACNTGRGRITGDGVIGLSRSFIAAGVPSVVVSLWAVPDAPTSELMSTFYKQLQQNPNKAQALRQAMLTTMKTHPHPINWAAFTLIGESE